MLFLTESDVRALLPMEAAIDLMEAMFHRLASAASQNQPRRRLMLPSGSVLHYMAAADGAYFGAKIYSTNARHGAHFLFLLYAAADARPLAIMEANYLGQIRTGAASGYATKLLARPDAARLGIIGSGFQARTQVAAMRAVRPIRLVKIWSRSVEKREAFAREAGATAVDTADRAVRDCDIVVTATNAKQPVLDRRMDLAGHAHQRHGLEPGATPRASYRANSPRRPDRGGFDRAGSPGIGRSAAGAQSR